MPIYSEDIRTRKAAVAGQFPDSGGRIHPTEYVVHNEVGNLFPKLTEVDHAGGRVDLSKAYLSIETTGIEQGDDCYTYLDQSPADPLVDCLLFRQAGITERSNHTDERADAQAYIENYQIRGPVAPWFLRGLHVLGMTTLTLWSRPTVRLPEVGQTLYLVYLEGEGGEHSQYVQISGYTWEDQTFSFDEPGTACGAVVRRLYYLTLTSALGANFEGPEVACVDPDDPDVVVRETVVADSSHYYGRAQLTAAASADDTTVQVDSVYGQVVPSARGEAPLGSVAALAAGLQDFTSGPETFTLSGPVHTQRERITAANRRANYNRTLLPIPASGGKVRAHARILDRWYTVIEGESNTVGTITCNRLSGSALLTLTAFPDADTWVIWEWPSAIHFVDRAGTAIVRPVTIPVTLPSVPEAETLSLSWSSGVATKTATESATGVISGDCSGYRVGAELVLKFAGGNMPNGGTTVAYAYAPLTRATETLTPTLTGNSVTVTLADPPRAGSITCQWSVQRLEAATAKTQTATHSDRVLLGGSAGNDSDAYDVEATETSVETNGIVTRLVNDDGAGAIGGTGTVNYATGEITLPVQGTYSYSIYEITINGTGDEAVESGTWVTYSATDTYIPPLTVHYALAATVPGDVIEGEIDVPPIEIQLLYGTQDQLVLGTVRFTLGPTAYSDRDGTAGRLYLADGTVAGTMDYTRRTATLDLYGSSPTVTITSLVSTYGQFTIQQASFRLAGSPIAMGSFEVTATEDDGDGVLGTGNSDGSITGTGVDWGSIEHDIGAALVNFDAPVYPGTLRYSAIAFTIVPLNPEIIGIDPVRLPADGRVPKFRPGDYVAIYEDADTNLANPAVAGSTVTLAEGGLAHVVLRDGAGEEVYTLAAGVASEDVIQVPTGGRTGPLEYCVLEDAYARPVAGALYDVDLDTWQIAFPVTFSADGYDEPFSARYLALVHPDDYTVDADAGEITWADPLDLTGYTQPIVAGWRKHDLSLVVEAQTTGLIQLQSALTHDYTTAAGISAMLIHGDLVARVANGFVENTQPANWADYLQGSLPSGGANYDWTGYPVQVANNGAIRERWRLKRRSDGQWDVIGETLGVIMIWAGSATLNAKRSTSQAHPYFTLYHEGLGTGWATGNIIQFETFAAQGPLWALRTVKPGTPTVSQDAIRLRHRVGAD